MNAFFLEPNQSSDGVKKLESLFNAPKGLMVAVAYFNSVKFADLILERNRLGQNVMLPNL